MPDTLVRCPKCQSGYIRRLEMTVPVIDLWYYRCQACGHVWTVRIDTGAFYRDITVDRPTSDHGD